METINRFLFVYGTLLQPDNEFAEYLNQHCKFISEGKVKGLLYDIGEYPGALIDSSQESYIYGNIFRMDEPGAILKVIDDYEGIGELYNHPQEYIREQVDILTDNGNMSCWMYIYNLTVDTYRQIPAGDYIQYLKDRSAQNNAFK